MQVPTKPSTPAKSRRSRGGKTFLLIAFCLGLASCRSIPLSTDDERFKGKYDRDFKYSAIEVTKQSGHYSCGVACLASVIKYWDKDVPEKALLEKYPKPPGQGYLLVELKLIALAQGLKAYAISMESEPRSSLEKQVLGGRPVICAVRIPRHLYLLHWLPVLGDAYEALTWLVQIRKDHYVVVFGLSEDRVLVMDPSFGFTSFSWTRFEKTWSKMKYAALVVSG